MISSTQTIFEMRLTHRLYAVVLATVAANGFIAAALDAL